MSTPHRARASRPSAVLRHLTAAASAALLSATLVAAQLSGPGPGDPAGSAVATEHGVVDGQLQLVGATVGERVKKALRVARNQGLDRLVVRGDPSRLSTARFSPAAC